MAKKIMLVSHSDREPKLVKATIQVREGDNKKKTRLRVKRQARMNRETSKWDRAKVKRKKSSTSFAPGDLVRLYSLAVDPGSGQYVNATNRSMPMIVVSIDEGAHHDTIVDVMKGSEILRYKAINLRKVED